MKTGDFATAIGKGLIAGAIGTAAMTLSSSVEARLRKREPSTVPAEAARKILGLEPSEPDAAAKLSTVAHWGYGTSWGAVRGVLGMLGLRAPIAAAVHFAAVWGSDSSCSPRSTSHHRSNNGLGQTLPSTQLITSCTSPQRAARTHCSTPPTGTGDPVRGFGLGTSARG